MPIFNNSKIKLQEGIYNLCGFYKYEKTLDLSNIQSKVYQKNYVSFYRLRRDKKWIKQYFNILDIYYKKHQKGENYCFRDILQDLYNVRSKSKKGSVNLKSRCPSLANYFIPSILTFLYGIHKFAKSLE